MEGAAIEGLNQSGLVVHVHLEVWRCLQTAIDQVIPRFSELAVVADRWKLLRSLFLIRSRFLSH